MGSSLRRFENNVAVVTGGASGIGRAIVERLAAEGATAWVADIDLDAATRVTDGIDRARAVRVDVSSPESVSTMVNQVIDECGRIDVLANNAGVVTAGAPVWETAWEDWTRISSINLAGVFLGCRYVMPHMIAARSGAIVSTASDAAKVGWPFQSAYCASKAGVVALTRSAASDAAPYGVRVNCVLPAFTDTEMLRSWLGEQPDAGAALEEVENTQPVGRIGRPSEIAAAVAFLASSEAAMVTGVALSVDGGVTAAAGPARAPQGRLPEQVSA
jgi:NAD(P)-dependent dehydrogenase (short-subunit alcohol dehydrogenase family)